MADGIKVYVANGNITPSTFVKIDATFTTPNQGNRVITAGSGDSPIGVAQKGTRYTPLTGLDNGFAAIAGQDVQVFLLGAEAPLTMGGTVNAGDWIKPNTNGDGTGIATSTPGDHFGARTPMAAISGQIVDVQVAIGTL